MHMDYTYTMFRYELKYILSPEQYSFFMNRIKDRMEIDKYGHTTLYSLYYDTPNKLLIRSSIENPDFKEKIRVRSYGVPKKENHLFLEIKRKNNGVVYKRRISTDIKGLDQFFNEKNNYIENDQIASELQYFKKFYKQLDPCFLIIYDRKGYNEINGTLRITCDENLRYRTSDLDFYSTNKETPILQKGYVVLEIKIQDSMPLWLAKILSEGQIYQTSFSKVGEAYKKELQLSRGLERRNI